LLITALSWRLLIGSSALEDAAWVMGGTWTSVGNSGISLGVKIGVGFLHVSDLLINGSNEIDLEAGLSESLLPMVLDQCVMTWHMKQQEEEEVV
jgi:hypothetical protein